MFVCFFFSHFKLHSSSSFLFNLICNLQFSDPLWTWLRTFPHIFRLSEFLSDNLHILYARVGKIAYGPRNAHPAPPRTHTTPAISISCLLPVHYRSSAPTPTHVDNLKHVGRWRGFPPKLGRRKLVVKYRWLCNTIFSSIKFEFIVVAMIKYVN